MPSTTGSNNDELTRITELAKGAVDTAVGLGVLGLQKLQVGRVELHKRLAGDDKLGAGYTGLRTEAFRRASQLDAVVGEALRTVESSLQPVTGLLPEPARHVATVAQSRIDELHAKVSHYLAAAAIAGKVEESKRAAEDSAS
ncbi:MAG: hypothetical protein ACRDVW_05720 [Acidimicrobiales bacterium]